MLNILPHLCTSMSVFTWKLWEPPTLLTKITITHLFLQKALTRIWPFFINYAILTFKTKCSIMGCLNSYSKQNFIPNLNLKFLHISSNLNLEKFSLPPTSLPNYSLLYSWSILCWSSILFVSKEAEAMSSVLACFPLFLLSLHFPTFYVLVLE